MKKIFINLIFIIGILILLYPLVGKLISIKNQTIAIESYDKKISNMELDKKSELNEQLKKYNEDLYNIKTNYNNSTDNEVAEQEMDTANFYPKGEIISYITIPKININIPIYEGSSNFVLEKGIGHLENTSFPTGGINTHTVLVGHSGLATKELFNSLDKLVVDDNFYIRDLDNFLKYKIVNIEIVEPDDVEKLEIQENEDLATLVTCIPKYINTHRLLVTGKRDKIQKEDEIISKEQRVELIKKANGNNEVAKRVLARYGYESSEQIKVNDYEKICNEVEAEINL